MQRNVYPQGFEEMQMMPMPPQYAPMDPQMQGGFYPGQGPFMYPPVPGAVMMPRPGFIAQGPPPMAMMPGGQPYMPVRLEDCPRFGFE